MRSPIDLIFPPTCVLCGAPGAQRRDLCPGCAAALPHNDRCCARCARPLEAAPAGALCGQCARHPPPFDRCIAALRYEGPVPHLMALLKFHHRLNVARLLGELLADALETHIDAAPEVLIPVPLHRSRLAQRGYNQALEIARIVARRLGIVIDIRHCTRIGRTAPQTGLDEQARRRNVRDAFAARGPLPWRRIALVDDVVTTGSTVGELARVLRHAGAEHIEVWATARTP